MTSAHTLPYTLKSLIKGIPFAMLTTKDHQRMTTKYTLKRQDGRTAGLLRLGSRQPIPSAYRPVDGEEKYHQRHGPGAVPQATHAYQGFAVTQVGQSRN